MINEVDIFKDLEYTQIDVQGKTIEFPIKYYDYSRITASFPLPIKDATKMLPSPKLKPMEIKPEYSVISFTAFQYRKIEKIQPYNEFAISIPTIYNDNPEVNGLYVIHLPVTTEEARMPGVEVYGYPKYIADISFDDHDTVCTSKVSIDGQELFSLNVYKLEAEYQPNDFYSFTVLNDKLVRTFVRSHGLGGTSNDSDGAVFSLGDHQYADNIRDLDIKLKPLSFSYSPRMQCLLNAPSEYYSL